MTQNEFYKALACEQVGYTLKKKNISSDRIFSAKCNAVRALEKGKSLGFAINQSIQWGLRNER